MKGTKGGFFDRLRERLRHFISIFKKNKKKIEKEEKRKKENIDKEKKKKKEEIINYFNEKNIKIKNRILIKKDKTKKNENKKDINIKYKVINTKKIENKELIKNISTKKSEEKCVNDIKNIKANNTNKIVKNNNKNNFQINNINNNINIKESYNKFNKPYLVNTNLDFVKNDINNIENINKIKNYIIKLIKKDKNELLYIIDELKYLENKINNEKKLENIKKYEEKIIELKLRIQKILDNYENLKKKISPNILLNVNDLESNKIDGLYNNIEDEDFNIIISKYESKLDFYEEIINAYDLSSKVEEKNLNKKIDIMLHKKELDEENNEISFLVKESNKIFDEMKKQSIIIKDLSEKIDNIKINQNVIKYDNVNKLLNKTNNFIKGMIALPMFITMNPALIAVGSYLIASSFNGLRKKINSNEVFEEIYYTVDKQYIDKIRNAKYSIEALERMINSNIENIDTIRSEYIKNFGNYHNYSDYNQNLNKFDEIKKVLVEKRKEIIKQKEFTKNLEDKNQKKLIYVNELNRKS